MKARGLAVVESKVYIIGDINRDEVEGVTETDCVTFEPGLSARIRMESKCAEVHPESTEEAFCGFKLLVIRAGEVAERVKAAIRALGVPETSEERTLSHMALLLRQAT